MPQIVGVRTTGQVITDERLVRVVDSDIGMLEPDIAPLITMLMHLKKRQRTTSPRFEWYESDYVARWTQNSGDSVANNAASTTVSVTDGTLFVAGDLFLVPKAVGSSVAPEICRVTVVTGNVLTVVRDVGGAGVDIIAADAALRLLGSSFAEAAALATAKCKAPTKKTGYTQIDKTACRFSKTAIASEVYGAAQGDRQREHKIKMEEHKRKLNDTLLFGRASEVLTAGAEIRTSAGLMSVISTNKVDAGGLLTRKAFAAFAEQAFEYGQKDTKVLVAPGRLMTALNQWATKFLMVRPGEKKLGLPMITQVDTGHGTWLVVRDRNLQDGVSGKNGFAGVAFSVDLDEIVYRYLEANGVNRDTKLTENADQTGGDYVVDEILTEYGYQIKQEKYHATLFNVTDYSE